VHASGAWVLERTDFIGILKAYYGGLHACARVLYMEDANLPLGAEDSLRWNVEVKRGQAQDVDALFSWLSQVAGWREGERERDTKRYRERGRERETWTERGNKEKHQRESVSLCVFVCERRSAHCVGRHLS
jgi:hypothetical protein